MCELLIFAKNNTHSDPEKDRRGCYKIGATVVAFEDGHTWGREESKQQWIADGNTAASWPGQDKWAIIKIPGVPAAKAQELLMQQTEDDNGIPLARGNTYRRRRWQFAIAAVPTAIRNTLSSDGEYTTTVSAIRNYLSRIRDGAQFTGFD